LEIVKVKPELATGSNYLVTGRVFSIVEEVNAYWGKRVVKTDL
jgi:hypothetical protein